MRRPVGIYVTAGAMLLTYLFHILYRLCRDWQCSGGTGGSKEKRQKRQAHSKSFANIEACANLARASWSAAVRSAAFALRCCDLPRQSDGTQPKAPMKSVCTLLLATCGVLAGFGAEAAKSVV